jgi:flagellar biosynthesis protein FlhA
MSIFKSPDIQLALGILGIVFTMILPLPPIMLDVLLSVSIMLSVLILLVSIYVTEPLDFSTFPTVLLISTLFRLGLNVATTRSILLNAQGGEVSSVVSAFGNFVVGGNYFVGFVLFVILSVINFIVITKGAGRVAEVGARFTLDAMPGKQMAIDAELNAGLIDRDEARRRRQKIEREADFYGSMDGASKFVRGDAIAGIIITGVNIVVGLILGVLKYDMDFTSAAELYTLLTVGDGLVSQIPALIVSTAAGIVVTRSGSGAALSASLGAQLLKHPKALYICSVMLLLLGSMPGMPLIPFSILSVGFVFLGRMATRKITLEKDKVDKAKASEESTVTDSVENMLHVDTLALEVGVGLIPLVDSHQDGEILERIVSSRKQFAQEMGIIVPMVMVRDNIQLKPGDYQIMLKGNKIDNGSLMVDHFLAMDPGDIVEPIEGIKGKEPAYGLDALWIKKGQKEEAIFRGYTVVNCATVVVTHLTKLVEEHAHELLGRQESQNLIDGLKQDYPKVVEEVLGPDRLSLGEVVRVLQNLLEEKVSIRDLRTIFEVLADYCKGLKHPDVLTRYVRIGLGRGIIKKYLTLDDKLIVTTLDRGVEDLLVSGLQHREDGSTTLQIDPEIAHRLLNNVAKGMELFQNTGTQPIILCGSLIRWEFKRLLKRFIPGAVVLAFDELPQGTKTQTLGTITL